MAMKQRKRYIKGKTNPQAHDFIGSNKSRKDSKNQLEAIKKKKKNKNPVCLPRNRQKKTRFHISCLRVQRKSKTQLKSPT